MKTAIQHFDDCAVPYHKEVRKDSKNNSAVHSLGEIYFNVANDFSQARKLPDKTVLDVCIGSGASSRLFQKNGYTVHGIDGSERLLNIASQCGFDNNNLTLGDVSDPLPYADNSFSITLTACSLGYIANATEVVGEMLRVTKPGGIVLLDTNLHIEAGQSTMAIDSPFSERTGVKSYLQSAYEFEAQCNNSGSPEIIDLMVKPEINTCQNRTVLSVYSNLLLVKRL